MRTDDRKLLRTFTLIAFGWTWALWTPALIYSHLNQVELPSVAELIGSWPSYSAPDRAFAVVFQLAVYGPLIGALIALLLVGRARLSGWKKSLFRVRVPLRWYAFVLGWPVALSAILIAVSAVVLGESIAWIALPAAGTISTMVLLQLVTSGLEEPGWRGLALPLYEKAYGFENGNWRLGLVWAAWHLPYVIYLYRDIELWMLPLTVAGFTMSIVAMAYVHAWVYRATGSVPLNILLHAWANTTNTVVAMLTANPVVPVLTAVIAWIFAAWAIRQVKREDGASSTGATSA